LGTLWDICHLVARIDIRATDVMSQCLTCHTQKSATFCDIRDIRGTPLPPPAFCLPPTALWMLQTLQNAPLFEPNGVFIIFLRGTLPISPQRAESDFAQTAGRPSSSTAPLFSRSTGLARYASGAQTAATAAIDFAVLPCGVRSPGSWTLYRSRGSTVLRTRLALRHPRDFALAPRHPRASPPQAPQAESISAIAFDLRSKAERALLLTDYVVTSSAPLHPSVVTSSVPLHPSASPFR
jgi:hypothetical protein